MRADETPVFHGVPVATLWLGMPASRLELWDEDRGRLAGFRRRAAPQPDPRPRGGDPTVSQVDGAV